MTNTNTSEAGKSIRFCIRSYIAFVLAPETPIIEWLAALDKWAQNSPGYFAGKPIVLDLSRVDFGQPGIAHLLKQLAERDIRVIGLEGADASQLGPAMPPLLTGGRASERPAAAASPDSDTAPAAPGAAEQPTSLLIETPVRSGQSVIFPNGDVTVLGSVASGSEIVAGGSIHVYGTLRGRAMAGSIGNDRARIFCGKNEAELLAIDGHYRTADEWDVNMTHRPVQCWLEDGVLRVGSLEQDRR